jgi:hypothetical protein
MCLKRLWQAVTKRFSSVSTSLPLGTSIPSTVSFQASVIRVTATGGQQISARRISWVDIGTPTEIDTAKRFSQFVGNGLSSFEKVEQRSDIDVIGRSPDGAIVEKFQVTRLWDSNFWRSLKDGGAADIELSAEDLSKLVLDALERKRGKYSLQQRMALILLIDTTPEGILPSLIPGILSYLADKSTTSAFKEVWLVGRDQDKTYKMA